MSKNGTIRLQVEMEKEGYAELQRLMKETGTRTMKELTNNAFTLLKWAIKKRKEGASIVAMNEKRKIYVELGMPILEVVIPNTETE
ncbi:MAG: hypothetical protein Q7K40_01100 [bacterium]|nr:hypothetical protein [bacterium]